MKHPPPTSIACGPVPAAPRSRWLAALACLAVVALADQPAHAALGQDAASIETDRIQVRASARQVSHAAYTVHELTTGAPGATGIVREYASPAGQVFAVTWHGPTMPNLQQIMGTHCYTLAAAPHRVGARSHLALQANNLVFESSGHVRAFHGRAYLANAIPAGVTVNEIQ